MNETMPVLPAYSIMVIYVSLSLLGLALTIAWIFLPFVIMRRLREISEKLSSSTKVANSELASIRVNLMSIAETSRLTLNALNRSNELAEWTVERKMEELKAAL